MFEKFLKGGTEVPRCPMCRTILEMWGEEADYPQQTLTKFYKCNKCGYKRSKMSKLNEVSSNSDMS